MRKATNYLIALLSLIAVTLISSCSSDDDNNPETGPPSYLEEKVPLRIGSQTFMLSLFNNTTGLESALGSGTVTVSSHWALPD